MTCKNQRISRYTDTLNENLHLESEDYPFMDKLDMPFGSTTTKQRWQLFAIAIIVFTVLVCGFSVVIDNLTGPYGIDNPKTSEHSWLKTLTVERF